MCQRAFVQGKIEKNTTKWAKCPGTARYNQLAGQWKRV